MQALVRCAFYAEYPRLSLADRGAIFLKENNVPVTRFAHNALRCQIFVGSLNSKAFAGVGSGWDSSLHNLSCRNNNYALVSTGNGYDSIAISSGL